MPDSSTILLVDDEDSIQKLLTYPLEREGFRVLQARDGEEALRQVASDGETISAGGLRIDLSRRTVEVRNQPVQLTYVEFELLASGSGLGLAIARELAELMSGSVELHVIPGRTIFGLVLPASAPEPFPREKGREAEPSLQ